MLLPVTSKTLSHGVGVIVGYDERYDSNKSSSEIGGLRMGVWGCIRVES